MRNQGMSNSGSKPTRSSDSNRSSATTSSSSSEESAQVVIALIAFFFAAVPTYQNSDENWILAGIVGLIAGWLAGKFFKLIIILIVIIGFIYFFSNN